MHLLVETITIAPGLLVEIINIGKARARPKTVLDEANAPLDFALRLGLVRLANPWRNSQSSHEIGKERIPLGHIVLYLQEDTLHAVGQCGLGQAVKVLECLHHAANHRWRITAFDKRDKAHA